MGQDTTELPANLRLKFPNLRPIKKAPSLATINGCGVAMYGNRDADVETGSYVKTHCISVLYVPLVALGAYRVANAPNGGWYFIGKEPLSGFARNWNWSLLGLVLLLSVTVGLSSYRSSPNYQAAQQLKQADKHLENGEALKAATLYRRLLDGQLYVAEARQQLPLALEPCLKAESADTVERAFRLLNGVQPAVLPDASKRGFELVEKFRQSSPEGALNILRAVTVLDPKNEAFGPLEITLLKDIIAANPDNTNRVVELAVLYENKNQLEESHKLLLPYRQKLGATEGARILGQYLLKEGHNNDAYGLLYPYVQGRLDNLRSVERDYTNAVGQAVQRAMGALNEGKADPDFYRRYKQASEAEQRAMVDNFIENWMRSDAAYNGALSRFTAANKIVPVALDLGIVQLNRAQSLQQAAARKAELEAAEKTFLAIRAFAGQSDEYRLFLGEVNYWLGKPAEGKRLFDDLLAAHKRAFPILTALSTKLRLVGEESQARLLAEEAYRTATTAEQRFDAAGLRAAAHKDADDRIAWLEKTDPQAALTQIALNSARGEKALQDQNRQLAGQFLRKAIAGYEGIQKSSTALNNQGLVYLSLYRATGDVKDHQRGLSLLEEAVALEPSNSLLLNNTMHLLLSQAFLQVVGNSIRLGLLNDEPDMSTLTYLYNDEQERNVVYQRLRENESFRKAVSYLDRALVLAPRRLDLYFIALRIHGAFRDTAELEKLQQRFKTAAPDLTDYQQEYAAVYSGSKDAQNLERIKKNMERLQELLALPGVAEHTWTREYTQLELNDLKESAWNFGADINADELVDSTASIYEKHPSSASRGSLSTAYFLRALLQLSDQHPPVAEMIGRTRRAVHAKTLITWLVERDGPLAEQVRRHPDVQKGLALERETCRRFTSTIGPDDWALFRTTDPAEAARIAAAWKENNTVQLRDELQFQVAAATVSVVLERYWACKLKGDEAQAQATYQEALKKGLPLPAL